MGVGIGGTFDRVALLAKRALLRPLGSRHPDPYYAAMEQELLEKINELGTGPQGFGGRTTALGLQIETFPTHIAGLPVAVNINCHVTRHAGGGAVMEYKLTAPLSKADAAKLRAGDTVLLSGTIYTARDAAHKRLCALAAEGKPLPFAIEDAVVYYAGPTPARPGGVIGSVGPTTSYRMDAYAPTLLDMGQTGMIGKGARGPEVVAAMRRTGAVYFAAIGGAGAAIAACVQSAELVCWEDLGSEAVRRLCVRDMPLTVVIDSQGENLYESGPAAYRGKPAGTLNSNRSGPRRILKKNAARPACTAHAQNGSSPRR